MKQSKRISVSALLLIYLCVLLCACSLSTYEPRIIFWRPEEGIWYCEELQIQLSFEENHDSYMVIDGIQIRCVWENDTNSQDIRVLCQGANTFGYGMGESLFSGRYVELSDDQYVVENRQTREQYTFIRQDEPID